MGTVRFVLRKDQPNKDGSCPVRLIYQIGGKRKYFLPGKTLFPKNWDDKNQKALYLNKKAAKSLLPDIDYNLLPTEKEVNKINDSLAAIRNDIADIENLHQLNKVVYNTEMIIKDLKAKRGSVTKKDSPKDQVFDFMDRWIFDNKTTREKGSLSVYKSVRNHLYNYCKKSKKQVTFENIDYGYFKSLALMLTIIY